MRQHDPVAGYLETIAGPAEPYDAAEAAIYVHFPFCRHLCTYCDFDTFTGIDHLIDSYVPALVRQIETSPPVRASSLYIGGGTPSIMSPEQAGSLASICRKRFSLGRDAEATIEANPTDMVFDRMLGFRGAGLNRLRVGVQSANPRLLRLLGRRHSSEDAEAAIRTARNAGFENLSVDLIYGVPLQDPPLWRETLDAAARWAVDHLSCYILTIEPGTALERGVSRGTLQLPPEDDVVAMYELACDFLSSTGYRHYEISNWARPGRESAHNLTYWRNGLYLGIGAGAAGHWAGRRYKLLPNVRAFVEGAWAGRIPLCEDEVVNTRRSMSETLILRLRLEEGVSMDSYARRFGASPDDVYGEALAWGEEAGLLRRDDGRLRLTERGVLLSNELFERLL